MLVNKFTYLSYGHLVLFLFYFFKNKYLTLKIKSNPEGGGKRNGKQGGRQAGNSFSGFRSPNTCTTSTTLLLLPHSSCLQPDHDVLATFLLFFLFFKPFENPKTETLLASTSPINQLPRFYSLLEFRTKTLALVQQQMKNRKPLIVTLFILTNGWRTLGSFFFLLTRRIRFLTFKKKTN